VAGVAVGPSDVNASAGGDMNFNAERFLSRVKGRWHCWRMQSALRFAVATVTRRNGIPVGASLRMAEERADALVQLRADDVFELAGLRVRFGILDGKGVLEEALGQAVAAHNVARALAAYGRELHFAVLHLHQMQV
jgi:hypothetical protein